MKEADWLRAASPAYVILAMPVGILSHKAEIKTFNILNKLRFVESPKFSESLKTEVKLMEIIDFRNAVWKNTGEGQSNSYVLIKYNSLCSLIEVIVQPHSLIMKKILW